MAVLPLIQFNSENGKTVAYVIGPRGRKRRVDYHEAWLAVAVGEAQEIAPNPSPTTPRSTDTED